MLAVNLAHTSDLKSLTEQSRNQKKIIGEHGEVDEYLLIKLAGHYLNKGLINDALRYCEVALQFNPTYPVCYVL